MFYGGSYDLKVDFKGRVPIPARFRRELKGSVVLARVADQCITAFPLSEWEKVAKKLGSSVIDKARMRDLKRYLFANAFQTDLDQQGRVLLPPALRERAGIGDNVTIAGTGNRFEIWDQETFQKQMVGLEQDAHTLIESLEE